MEVKSDLAGGPSETQSCNIFPFHPSTLSLDVEIVPPVFIQVSRKSKLHGDDRVAPARRKTSKTAMSLMSHNY